MEALDGVEIIAFRDAAAWESWLTITRSKPGSG